MYDHASFLIVGLLLLALLGAIELGFRLGRRAAAQANDGWRSQINAIQGSLLGVLALLLGFTFSQALQRFDVRSEAVVAEANAIGTAMQRADLLPAGSRDEAARQLGRYLELRIDAGAISLDQHERRAAALEAVEAAQQALWRLAAEAAASNPNAVQTGLFAQALNDVFDSYASRNAALDRHVPEIVLFLLFVTFLLTASLVGYSSGASRQRATFATYSLVVLITVLVFIIIDLDRPRRGLIEVSQQSLYDLRGP